MFWSGGDGGDLIVDFFDFFIEKFFWDLLSFLDIVSLVGQLPFFRFLVDFFF